MAVCLLAAATLLGLGGCCSINPFSRCAPEFQLTATAQADLNSCNEQGSYQVKLRIFSLASVEAFRAAEFETLWFEESDLDGSVLDVQTLTIQPASRLEHVWLRPAGTRAVGVVANFCQLDGGCWKQLLDVSDGSSKLGVDLAGTCMTAVAGK
jgi:type VI secretion system VasD/TssJ family lipoprotein